MFHVIGWRTNRRALAVCGLDQVSFNLERATVKEMGLPAKQIVRVTGLRSELSLSAIIGQQLNWQSTSLQNQVLEVRVLPGLQKSVVYLMICSQYTSYEMIETICCCRCWRNVFQGVANLSPVEDWCKQSLQKRYHTKSFYDHMAEWLKTSLCKSDRRNPHGSSNLPMVTKKSTISLPVFYVVFLL